MTNLNIQNLTLDNLAEWPIIIKSIVIFGGFLLCVGLGYFLDIKSQLQILHALTQQGFGIQQEWQAKKNLPYEIPVYQKQVAELQGKLSSLKNTLFDQTAFSGLLDEISKLSGENNLDLKSIKPLAEKSKDHLFELPAEISLTGNYQQLASFINALAKLDHIIVVQDLTMTPVKISNGEKLELNMLVTGYRSHDQQKNITPNIIPKKLIVPLVNRNPFAQSTAVNFSLNTLHMVGTLRQNNLVWALLATPDGWVSPVTVGAEIDKKGGKVIRIDEDKMEVNEQGRLRILTINNN